MQIFFFNVLGDQRKSQVPLQFAQHGCQSHGCWFLFTWTCLTCTRNCLMEQNVYPGLEMTRK
jgi:hypothetical protein